MTNKTCEHKDYKIFIDFTWCTECGAIKNAIGCQSLWQIPKHPHPAQLVPMDENEIGFTIYRTWLNLGEETAKEVWTGKQYQNLHKKLSSVFAKAICHKFGTPKKVEWPEKEYCIKHPNNNWAFNNEASSQCETCKTLWKNNAAIDVCIAAFNKAVNGEERK